MANIQKTAIVTGGSQGIGAGVVKASLDWGYNVVANSRNITKANRSRRLRVLHSLMRHR
jgi:NAD(P)-dependent dehydrogenase (short-subunit alcohol dehydrogenase family)